MTEEKEKKEPPKLPEEEPLKTVYAQFSSKKDKKSAKDKERSLKEKKK
jgi:hypothetical protein